MRPASDDDEKWVQEEKEEVLLQCVLRSVRNRAHHVIVLRYCKTEKRN